MRVASESCESSNVTRRRLRLSKIMEIPIKLLSVPGPRTRPQENQWSFRVIWTCRNSARRSSGTRVKKIVTRIVIADMYSPARNRRMVIMRLMAEWFKAGDASAAEWWPLREKRFGLCRQGLTFSARSCNKARRNSRRMTREKYRSFFSFAMRDCKR